MLISTIVTKFFSIHHFWVNLQRKIKISNYCEILLVSLRKQICEVRCLSLNLKNIANILVRYRSSSPLSEEPKIGRQVKIQIFYIYRKISFCLSPVRIKAARLCYYKLFVLNLNDKQLNSDVCRIFETVY